MKASERDRLQSSDENYIESRRELDVSIEAGEIVGKLYDALREQYIDPDSDKSLKSLNKLCVRLVFCLYAESTGVFGEHKLFHDYVAGARNIRRNLLDLFRVFATPIEERDPALADGLKIFPYVNGGLFDEVIEIPDFTLEIRDLLLDLMSSGFAWSEISPTILVRYLNRRSIPARDVPAACITQALRTFTRLSIRSSWTTCAKSWAVVIPKRNFVPFKINSPR